MQTVTVSIPKEPVEQVLTYKAVGDRPVDLVFYPPMITTDEPAPVYFLIPGGGWTACSKESMAEFSRLSAAELRRHGFAIVSIDYRANRTDGVVMDTIIADCMDAARYLARHATALHIDANRLVTSGHSAGGHLALMLAMAPHNAFTADSPYIGDGGPDFTVTASAPLSAPTILYIEEDGHATRSFGIEQLFGADKDDPAAYHRASPFDYLRDRAVPTFLAAGTHDPLVYPENSIRFYERCRERGVRAELVLSQNGGHCFECLVDGAASAPNHDDIQRALVAFVLYVCGVK